METIKVMILEDGLRGKEINPYGKFGDHVAVNASDKQQQFQIKQWREAESSLRTFEITYDKTELKEDCIEQTVFRRNPGSIHSAEILPSGKIKIID